MKWWKSPLLSLALLAVSDAPISLGEIPMTTYFINKVEVAYLNVSSIQARLEGETLRVFLPTNLSGFSWDRVSTTAVIEIATGVDFPEYVISTEAELALYKLLYQNCADTIEHTEQVLVQGFSEVKRVLEETA